MFSSVDKAWHRYTNRPGFAWTVQELARSVQCPGHPLPKKVFLRIGVLKIQLT